MSINQRVAELIGYREGTWSIERIRNGVSITRSAPTYESPWGYEMAVWVANRENDGWIAVPNDFDPENDLNAAWSALEKCGFWSHFYLARMNENCYAIHALRKGEDAYRRYPIGETPALAICNAIIAAGERK